MEVPTTFAPMAGAPAGRHRAVQAATTAQRLLALDEFWTVELAHASGNGPLDHESVEMFVELVGEIRAGLDLLARQAEELRGLLSEVSDEDFDAAFAAIASSPYASPDFEEVAETLTGGGFRSATVAACEYVQENAVSEGMELEQKLERIRAAGEVPEGDWKPPFRCAVALLAAGGAVTATIVIGGGPPVLVGILVADRVRSGLKEWVQEGCPAKLPHITFGRGAAPAGG